MSHSSKRKNTNNKKKKSYAGGAPGDELSVNIKDINSESDDLTNTVNALNEVKNKLAATNIKNNTTTNDVKNTLSATNIKNNTTVDTATNPMYSSLQYNKNPVKANPVYSSWQYGNLPPIDYTPNLSTNGKKPNPKIVSTTPISTTNSTSMNDIADIINSASNTPQSITLQSSTDKLIPVPNASGSQSVKNASGDKQSKQSQQSLIDEMKKYLQRYTQLTTIAKNNKESDVLTIIKDGKQHSITAACILHYFSGDNDFLENDKNSCDPIFKDLININGIDLSNLITESNDFEKSTEFYEKLYNFNIGVVAQLVKNQNDFNKLKFESKIRTLENTQKFISQTIDHLHKYMNSYDIYDNSLTANGNNLLYLFNAIAKTHVNTGRTVDELSNYYKKLIDATRENIELYKKISDGYKKSNTTMNTDSAELDNLYKMLESRLSIITDQKEKLDENIGKMDTEQYNLNNTGLVSQDVINIASQIEKINSNRKKIIQIEKK